VSGPQPPFEQGAPMAYDPLVHAIVLVTTSLNFACVSYTWFFANRTWTNETTVVSGEPPVTQHAAFVYDATDGYMLLYGGFDNCAFNHLGTWKFQNNTWTQVNETGRPWPKGVQDQGIAYDATDGYVVLFGGDTSNATWTYRAGVWTQLNLSVHPNGFANPGMAPNPKGGVLLFGGGGGARGGRLEHTTWEFLHGSWRQLFPAAHPPKTYDALLEPSAKFGDVLFGGNQGAGWTNATWTYSNGTWTDITASLSRAPPAVAADYFSGAYDLASRHIVVFLSPNGAGTAQQTWILS
jgi:hypothetical protein